MTKTKLTGKQKLFVEYYLQSWNASDAARRIGYHHPGVASARLMARPLVIEAINQRMDQISMQTDEVLTRLTQQARLNIGDFLIFEGDKISLNHEMILRYGYLVKELNWSRRGDPVLRMVDSQAALALIGKARRLFVEQIEETHKLDQTNVNIYIPANGREPLPATAQEGDDASD